MQLILHEDKIVARTKVNISEVDHYIRNDDFPLKTIKPYRPGIALRVIETGTPDPGLFAPEPLLWHLQHTFLISYDLAQDREIVEDIVLELAKSVGGPVVTFRPFLVATSNALLAYRLAASLHHCEISFRLEFAAPGEPTIEEE